MMRLYSIAASFFVLLIFNSVALSQEYTFISSPYIPHENWLFGSTQSIEWEVHTENSNAGAFEVSLAQNGQYICTIRSNYTKLDAIPVSGFFLMDDGFRWKYSWNNVGHCENGLVVEPGQYQIRLRNIVTNFPSNQSSLPFTIYKAQEVPEGLKQASVQKIGLPTGGKTPTKTPDFTAKETIASQIASHPIIKEDTLDKAYAPPKITMPYHNQLITGPITDGKTPFHYRVAFPEQVNLTIQFQQYELPEGIYPVDYEPKPTGTWHTVFEKTIPAAQLSLDDVYGYYTFTEVLYMESGRHFRIKAKAHLSSNSSTGWSQAVGFYLNCNIAKLADADLTPVELSLHQNRSQQCELWMKIRNKGVYRYEKPLQWEVFKDGKWVGTWGTGNDNINIGPDNEADNTVDQRVANPAALTISPYGIHKYQIKLLPHWNEMDKINNISSKFTLQCKTLTIQQKSEKAPGISTDTLSPQTSLILIQGKKMFYRSGEQALFTLAGNQKRQPVVECFSKNRWSRKCPAGTILRRTGQQPTRQYSLKLPQAGQYRLRMGPVVSKTVTVKSKRKQPVTTRVEKQQQSGPPDITLNRSVFTVPAKVQLKVKTLPGFKLTYVLEKKSGGRYQRVKTLRSLSFTVSNPGYYRVKASYNRSSLVTVKPFEVKEAKITRIQKTRKTQKTDNTRQKQPSRNSSQQRR